jgi:hypothetical protein
MMKTCLIFGSADHLLVLGEQGGVPKPGPWTILKGGGVEGSSKPNIKLFHLVASSYVPMYRLYILQNLADNPYVHIHLVRPGSPMNIYREPNADLCMHHTQT